MKLEHQFTVPAPVDETWVAFNDLERVVPCFPGASLTSFDGDEFTGSCKVKLGPISLVYNGSGKFIERDETLFRAVLEAKGKDKRGNGTAAATVTAQLTAADESATSVLVETDLSVTGKPAQFGRGVMQDVSDKMLAKFVECLQTRLGPGVAAPEAAAAEPTAAGPETGPETGPGSGPETGPETGPGTGPEKPGAEPPRPSTAASDGASVSAGESASGDEQPTPQASLDLGAAVLPVLAKRYGPYLLGLLVLLVVVRRILR